MANESSRSSDAAILALCLYIVIAIAFVGGWIANIVKLIGIDFSHITGMVIARAVGIFVAPLGAVLGYF